MKTKNLNSIREFNDDALARIEEHPFVRRASNGSLSEQQCVQWLLCAGRESKTFPDVLSNMIERTDNADIKKILQENLDDEHGNGDPEHAHFRHYLHLLEKIGMNERFFDRYEVKAGVSLALELATCISEGSDNGLSVGYMLVNEGMTPITYGAVEKSIYKYFPGLETEFFRMHVLVDEEHVEQLYVAIQHMGDNSLDAIYEGIQLGERGMAVLLDEAMGIFGNALSTAAA